MSAVLEICFPSSKLGFSWRLKHCSAICKIPWCVKPDVNVICVQLHELSSAAVVWILWGTDFFVLPICTITCISMTIHHFNIRCVQNMRHIMNIMTFHLNSPEFKYVKLVQYRSNSLFFINYLIVCHWPHSPIGLGQANVLQAMHWQ